MRATSTRRRAAGSVLLAVLAATAGCSDSPGDPVGPSTSTSTGPDASSAAPRTGDVTAGGTTPLATPDAGRFPTYVALGDSFTSAPLVGETDRADGCLRSTQNYPRLVADALGAELTDVSCAGADTTSLVGAQPTLDGAVPAQLEALEPDTSLVTIGIGGNDFGIYSTLVGACVRARQEDPDGAPCREQLGPDGVAELRANIDTVGDRLVAAVRGIRDRAPEAEVVVVGYPEIVPADATCSDVLPLAEGDQPFAARMNRLLADTQERAARRVGARYVDLYAASDGHDVCSDDPWVNGRITRDGVALAYHPLAAGQQVTAGLVLDALAG
ncbi:SGNH/GDSL hydrolase family protein [Nocardioides sp. SYSU DS0663]|uniref:SGNH/GDSL hydrolase family protein n=1 Tax=Nocardioides sp. SYSU DS0663 TaxID=3416445 RepID=UPI003F4B5E28